MLTFVKTVQNRVFKSSHLRFKLPRLSLQRDPALLDLCLIFFHCDGSEATGGAAREARAPLQASLPWPCLPGCDLCLVSKVLNLSLEIRLRLLLVLVKAVLKLPASALLCLGEDSAWLWRMSVVSEEKP